MVFPLVFLLFPAFFTVTLGPAVVRFVRVLFGEVGAADSDSTVALIDETGPPGCTVPAGEWRTQMETSTIILFAVAGVFLLLYMMRRRGRLNREE